MNLPIVASGILGTLAMTLFIELICKLAGKPFHVIRILASMLPFGRSVSSKGVYIIAVIIHYSIGVLFSFVFIQAVRLELLALRLIDAIFFGALAGTVGIIGWRIFFAIHPSPPNLNLHQYLLVIWLGHIVFSITQLYTYLQLT